MEEKIKVFKDIGLDFNAKRKKDKRLSAQRVKIPQTEEEKNASHEKWMQMYEQLKAFKEENGQSLPPSRPRTPLFAWVQKQRNDYKKFIAGNPSEMTAIRSHYLNSIQFPFLATFKKISWDDRYEELKLYKAKHGNITVPKTYPGKTDVPKY